MNVGELIEELKQCDPEDKIVLSIDSEGNGYDILHNISIKYKYHEGEIKIRTLDQENIDDGYTEEDLCGEEDVACVVLWP